MQKRWAGRSKKRLQASKISENVCVKVRVASMRETQRWLKILLEVGDPCAQESTGLVSPGCVEREDGGRGGSAPGEWYQEWLLFGEALSEATWVT